LGCSALSLLSCASAGNPINDGNGNQPTYDAENRIVTDAGVNYYYDADGFRMEKSSGTMYWPGPGGEVLAETDLSGNINEEYVYFNGERLARVDRPSGTVHYYFSDHLGSASTITDASGNVQERYYYYPYGGLVSSIGSDPNHYKFTGKERDTESNLDNFGARFYTSNIGRFMTPDWAARPTAVPYAVFGDPQTLNLYTYVENGPVNRADADGHQQNVPAPPSQICMTTQAQACKGDATKDLQRMSGAQNTKTVANTTIIGTSYDERGNKTTVSQTTTVTFSTAKGHEGEFLGATVQTSVHAGEVYDPVVAQSGQVSVSQKEAAQIMGSKAFTDAQQSAVPSGAQQFGHQVAQDVIHHPLGVLGVVVRSAALPVGVACPWCGVGMAIGGEALAMADSAKDVTPYP